MWTDDNNFPSMEDNEPDIENDIPEGDWEWLAGWLEETLPADWQPAQRVA